MAGLSVPAITSRLPGNTTRIVYSERVRMSRPRPTKGRRHQNGDDPYADPSVGGIGWEQSASEPARATHAHGYAGAALDNQILSLMLS